MASQLAHDNLVGKRILIVDDEDHISDLISTALRYEGCETRCSATGAESLAAMSAFRPDLVVLDLMLPDIDGLDLTHKLRSAGEGVPIVMLTARDSTEEKVRGLRLGADDYVTKPFSLEELILRIRSVLRRVGPPAGRGQIQVADLILEEDLHEVRRAGVRLELTPTEFRLLHYMLVNARRVLTKAQILDHVWRYDFNGNANVLETYIGYLRRKVDALGPPLIHTIRGVGYILRDPDS
ncbi:MAG TPA: response regulator transcription factor [Candidatus Dormibacteraeota bacterium]|jgi:two-component system OmpR family response regulator|nr:response regulator transcription factor [Candidatus Dormibacteraeota bacterium]